MDANRLIRGLWPSVLGRFAVLSFPLSCSHIARQAHGAFVGCLIGLPFLFSAGTVVAAPCWTVTGVFGGRPTLGFEDSANTNGLFQNAYTAFKSVEQVAVKNANDFFSQVVAPIYPDYVGCRVTSDPLSQYLIVSSTSPSRPDWPGWVLNWTGTWANDAGFCPGAGGPSGAKMVLVSIEALNTPVLKNPVNLARYSEGFIDRVNSTCPTTQQQYTIKLSNDASLPSSGDLAEVEPGKATTTLRAKVYGSNNQIVPNANIRLEVTVDDNSGGHGHPDINRPKGLLSGNGQAGLEIVGNTGSDGLPFTFNAPAPAGDHKIIASCTDSGRTCTQEGPDKVWVGVKGLKQQASSINYVLLSNRDANHPENHYVATNTERNVSNFAAAYHRRFPNDPVLHFNDASLVRGGLFDIASNWSTHPGHETHRLGANVDVKANEFYHEPSQSIPASNYIDFWNMGRRYGCYVALHSGATPNEHFHLHCP